MLLWQQFDTVRLLNKLLIVISKKCDFLNFLNMFSKVMHILKWCYKFSITENSRKLSHIWIDNIHIHCCYFQIINWFRWAEAKALPGANRLIKHLKKNGVPMALASNSLREYIDAKISHHKGCFLLSLPFYFYKSACHGLLVINWLLNS